VLTMVPVRSGSSKIGCAGPSCAAPNEVYAGQMRAMIWSLTWITVGVQVGPRERAVLLSAETFVGGDTDVDQIISCYRQSEKALKQGFGIFDRIRALIL
jgi:hypothetical protein